MQRVALLRIATEVEKVVHTALRFARRACEVVQIFWPKWNAVFKSACCSRLSHRCWPCRALLWRSRRASFCSCVKLPYCCVLRSRFNSLTSRHPSLLAALRCGCLPGLRLGGMTPSDHIELSYTCCQGMGRSCVCTGARPRYWSKIEEAEVTVISERVAQRLQY